MCEDNRAHNNSRCQGGDVDAVGKECGWQSMCRDHEMKSVGPGI
jgi:hypothetical protein